MLKVALISDNLTASAISEDAVIRHVTPYNYWFIFKVFKPDILFIESAWQGYRNSWKYKIASYPDVPKRNNESLIKVIHSAKDAGIKTIFWNKEDSVHFNRFIQSAKHCDYIYTVDVNSVENYKKIVDKNINIDVLPFPIQPKIHKPTGLFKIKRCSFVGSFSSHIHSKRRQRQLMLFNAARQSGLDIFDRNSDRKNTAYRYPRLHDNINIFPAVSPEDTAKIYNDYVINLNINTVEDSTTMYSRRLVEIIACESIAITTPALSVEQYFKDYCYMVSSQEEAQSHIDRIIVDGISNKEKEMLKAGSHYVAKNFSYRNFLAKITNDIFAIKK